MRHERRHAVIAQAAGVEARRHEGRAERVHLRQRRQMAGVAEIVGVLAARQARAGCRLDRDRRGTACRRAAAAPMNGNAMPAKFEPPPVQPTTMSG